MSDCNRFEIIENRAYSTENGLFLKDSYPCTCIAEFDDGQIVACYEGRAWLLNEQYVPIEEMFPNLKTVAHVRPVFSTSSLIDRGQLYNLTFGTRVVFKTENTYITADDNFNYYITTPTKLPAIFDRVRNTVIYTFEVTFIKELSMIKFISEDDEDVFYLYTKTKLPILSVELKDNIYSIKHDEGSTIYYYITGYNDSFILVSAVGDVIELTDNISDAVTSRGEIKKICDSDECTIHETPDENKWEIKYNDMSFILNTINVDLIQFDVYLCGHVYFICDDDDIYFAINSSRGRRTKPALRSN